MTWRAKKLVFAGLAVLAVVGLNALVAPLVYFAKPIHGRVVDAVTGQPIVGAVVVAEWIPYALIFVDRSTPMQVLETVTDAQGNYSFQGWGPKLRHLTERLDYLDPHIIVFRTGYKPYFASNDVHRNTCTRTSDRDGQTLEVQPFQETPERRLDQLRLVLQEAGVGAGHLPRLFDEMLKEAPLPTKGAKPFFEGVGDLKQKGL